MFPGHKNVLEFKADDEFVSVGIGPLCDDNECVEMGKPASHFKGNMKFIAIRMGLKYPLMHMGSQDEIKIFTDFMTDHAPTEANFRRLAKIYRQRANGITIFPKLPSVLKSHYKIWEQNRKIKVAENAVNPNVKALLQRLWQSLISVKDVYFKNTIEATENKSESKNVLVAMKEEDKENVVAKYVPPTQAPTPKQYIPTTLSNQESRRCAWYPMCNEMARVCNGWHLNACIHSAKWQLIVNPETLTNMKKVEKNTMDCKRKAENWVQIKMQKKIRKSEHQIEKNKSDLKHHTPAPLQNDKLQLQHQQKESTNACHMLDTLPVSLDQSSREHVRKFICGTNSMNIVCTVNNHDVLHSDVTRLRRAKSKEQHLNDNIINAYMSILQREHDDRCKQESEKLNSIIYNTHFFFRLFDGGETQEFRYENVSRWWRRVDIFSLNKMFFPVHIKVGYYEH